MVLKRYIVDNMQDGIEKIKRELGSEAVILSTKELKKKGFKKFFTKPKIEIVAAYDDKEEISIHGQDSAKIRKDLKKPVKREDDIIPKNHRSSYDMGELEKRLAGIDSTLNTFMKRFDSNYSDRFANYSKTVRTLCNNMLENEVREDIVYKIADDITDEVRKNNLDENDAVNKVLKTFLGSEVRLNLKRGRPTVIMFVGNTGVGKTTTLLKLATKYAVTEKKEVAIITADTYKIASAEQVKTYSEILGVPLSVIYSGDELKTELEKYGEKDVIFIDTGKCPDMDEYKNVMCELIEVSNPDEVYIVMSAGTNYNSVRKTLEQYDYLKDYKFIITKMDEASSYGAIFNIKSLADNSISYLTDGQILTENIRAFKPDEVIDGLLGNQSGAETDTEAGDD